MIFPVSAWTFIPPQAETPTEVGKEIVVFHHEGFFWRCWFFGEGHPETIWTFWYSEYNVTTLYPRIPSQLKGKQTQEVLPGMRRQFLLCFCHSHLLSKANLAHSFFALSKLSFWLGFCSQRAVHRNVATSWGCFIYHLQSYVKWWLPPARRRTLPISPPSQ